MNTVTVSRLEGPKAPRLYIWPILKSPRHLCALLLVVALGGCGTQGGTTTQARPATLADVCERHWLLEDMSLPDHELRLGWRKLMRDRPHFYCNSKGQVKGSDGASPIVGKLAIPSSGALEWLALPKASRISGDETDGKLPRSFRHQLGASSTVSISGDRLVLHSRDGHQLVFRARKD